jgi:hypothetical protein
MLLGVLLARQICIQEIKVLQRCNRYLHNEMQKIVREKQIASTRVQILEARLELKGFK